MYAKIPVGKLVLFKTPVPVRNCARRIEAAMELIQYYNAVDRAEDRSAMVMHHRDDVLRLAVCYELEKIADLLEEACLSKQDLLKDEDHTHLSRDDLEQLVRARAQRTNVNVSQKNNVESVSYACDLLVHDPDARRIRWFHLVAGASYDKGIIGQWKSEITTFATALPRFARQYFDVDIQELECALIDPFLHESRPDDNVWSLGDIDALTGQVGTAEKILQMRSLLRERLRNKIGESFASDEETQRRLIDDALQRSALEANECPNKAALRILTPDGDRQSATIRALSVVAIHNQ
ncbi:hypothetical protein HWD97_23690 [Ochrobactrum sp. C6C9]|uniref:hypothetical protein n=1 Tax=Ochrobactrum sp. C6C9 TaxID=2736662 RepID=UPI00352FF7E6|nr:hypothetical protein [Ochrobactrum sp. C6C9]